MDGWIENSRHDWTLLTLPDRFWKWRMRHSAINMAEQVAEMTSRGYRWDAVFASDMLNVAEFRGIVSTEIRKLPSIVYFHENQLAYPAQENTRDLHFAFTNLTTTIAADHVWFNSAYNRDSMIGLLKQTARNWPDYAPIRAIEQIRGKSSIQYPGIECQPPKPNRVSGAPLHLIWAARWEHDKNPDDLLTALDELQSQGIDFRISLIGQVFRKVPDSVDKIRTRYESKIIYCGFLPDREAYWNALNSADVFISTAQHEFFGLSVAEAASIGLHVILPNRLSYPELLNVKDSPMRRAEHLYDGTPHDLALKIAKLANKASQGNLRPCHDLAHHFTEKFGWETRARRMDDEIESIVVATD